MSRTKQEEEIEQLKALVVKNEGFLAQLRVAVASVEVPLRLVHDHNSLVAPGAAQKTL